MSNITTPGASPKSDTHPSPSPSSLTFPETAVSNDSNLLANNDVRVDHNGFPPDVANPGDQLRGRPQPRAPPNSSPRNDGVQLESAELEQTPSLGRKPSFLVEEKKDSDHRGCGRDYCSIKLASEDPSMHLIPEVDPAEQANLKVDLGEAFVVFPSPFSPLDSVRPLTPPFPDDEEPDPPPDALPRLQVKIEDDEILHRRHSAIDLSPTNDAGYLFPPRLPDQRRYSLVDLGALTVHTRGRRTLSDVGVGSTDIRTESESHVNDPTDVVSGAESRSSSRPSTARFSTFAEMGIQSFAMAKGEKTINSENKKDTTSYEKKRRKRGGAQLNSGEHAYSGQSLQPKIPNDTREEVADDVVSTEPSPHPANTRIPDKRRKRKGAIVKLADCIIM